MEIRIKEVKEKENKSTFSQDKFMLLGLELKKMVENSNDIKFLTQLATTENNFKSIAITRLQKLHNNNGDKNVS